MEKIKEKNIQRQSNFEILRIIAMIMIIFHHLSVHSQFNYGSAPMSLNKLWIQFIQMGGKIGVNIFILITGYFLVNTDKIKTKKLLKLWGQILFTSISIYIISVILGSKEFEIKSFIDALFPIINETWWFASVYFLLYIISPYLNIILKNIDKNTYKKMICFMLICWCIIPTFKDENFQFNSLIWFIVLYTIAGYIRLYGEEWKISNKKCFLISGLLIISTHLVVLLLDKMNLRVSSTTSNINFIFNMQSLPIFLISIFLFFGFKKTNIQYNAVMNKIASTTFGIYLIHDNSYIRSLLWVDLFKLNTFKESCFFIPYSIFVCFIVFFICCIIDLFRKYTTEKYYMKFISILERNINEQ